VRDPVSPLGAARCRDGFGELLRVHGLRVAYADDISFHGSPQRVPEHVPVVGHGGVSRGASGRLPLLRSDELSGLREVS